MLELLLLVKIHWPVKLKKGSSETNAEDFLKPDIPSTWKAMEALYHAGKTRAIGVSNFSKKKLGDLSEVALVLPAVNQVECHPIWQQAELHAFCKENGIHLSVSVSFISRSFSYFIPIFVSLSVYVKLFSGVFTFGLSKAEWCSCRPCCQNGCGKIRQISWTSCPSMGPSNGTQCASKDFD